MAADIGSGQAYDPNSVEFLLWELKENKRTTREWDAWAEAGSDPADGVLINDAQCVRIELARARMKNGGLAHDGEAVTLAQAIRLRAGLIERRDAILMQVA